jgi:hypothetical protein
MLIIVNPYATTVSDRLRAGPVDVGQHRRHPGLLTLSEVIGHIDLLDDEGRVREIDEDGVIRFEAVA